MTRPRKSMEIEQRRKVVAANLMSGATYREIATALGVSVGTVASDYKALLKAWREHYATSVEEYLFVQMRRYDVLLNAIWDDARGGGLIHVDRALAIMDRQNALMQLKDASPLEDRAHSVSITVVPARKLEV